MIKQMSTWHIRQEDLVDICQFIHNGEFKKVGLQFPNELLSKAVSIAKQIEDSYVTCTVAILADTSFGSCCVDEVAGQHYSVDAIVHFGPACISSSATQLPVKHVFGHVTLDRDALRGALSSLSSDTRILLFYDFVYLEDVKAAATDNCIVTLPALPEYSALSLSPGVVRCGRLLPGIDSSSKEDEEKVLSSFSIVYVGGDDLSLTNILLSLNHCRSYHLVDVGAALALTELDRYRRLRRRLLLVEKASRAERIGLLVGTLGGGGRFVAMLDRLQRLIRARGRRCYTLMVGKLNPAKLQNFANIDCFVLVACPQNSLFDIRAAEDYAVFQPIVSPYEMEQACLEPEERSWAMDFVTDFQELLRLAEVEDEETRKAAGDGSSSSAVVLAPNKILSERNPHGAVSSLPQRAVEEGYSWFGLEPRLGETPVAAPTRGRTGIAIAYEEEEQ